MIVLAASIVRFWVRLYTAGLDASTRERIRQEVEADLWEQANGKNAVSQPAREAVIIMLRWILGIPADVHRLLEESNSGDFSMWSGKLFGVVLQRRSWLNLLILSGVSFSLLFIGIGTFIAGVFIIVIPAALIASPFVVLWSGWFSEPFALADVWQAAMLFLVGIAILVTLLHMARLLSLRLPLGVRPRPGHEKPARLAYQIFGVLYNRRAWTSLLLILFTMLSLVFVGVGTFTAALVLAVITGAFIGNPFIYPQHTVKVGPVLVDSPVESALLVIAGLGLALIIMHLANLVVGSIGRVVIARYRPAVASKTV